MKRTILVTGGNRGIGRAICQELAKDLNNKVLLGHRAGSSIEDDNLAANIYPVECDLTDKKLLQGHLKEINSFHGNIHCLINNAGVLDEGTINEVSLESFENSIRVNTLAPFQLIKFFLPNMIENNYGRIVNITSGWGSFTEGLDGPLAYATSKAALNAITKSSSKNLPSNVKVNSMCPGWVRTRMGGEAAERSPEKGAETAVWLCNLDDNGPSGLFFRDQKEIPW